MVDKKAKKKTYKIAFNTAYQWLLANCDLDHKDRNFFTRTAHEMVVLSDGGTDALLNALLIAVYSEFDRRAAEELKP